MELTTTVIIAMGLTGFISSALSLGAKLIYDGIKTKKNESNGSNGNKQISINFALLAKDIDFNNKKLVEIAQGIDKLIELSIVSKEQSNIHLIDLKTSMADQTNTFRTLISALTATMAKLESKLN